MSNKPSTNTGTNIDTREPFSYPLTHYPVALIDYFWIITMYVGTAFLLATTIDEYILPPLDYTKVMNDSTPWLGFQILLQLSLQGFVAIFLCGMLQKIPSPVDGIFGYDYHSSLGLLLRNPAIINIILFALSKSLQGKILIFFSRFNENAKTSLTTLIPPPIKTTN
jgi:hypothetical protein